MNRRLARSAFLLLVLLGISLLGRGQLQTGRPSLPSDTPPSPVGYVPVVKVDDGDTIVIRTSGQNETVRFIGIDTPEIKDPRKPVQCYAREASAQTHHLLDGQSVRLEGDPKDSDRDKYHRLLRYVYTQDGTLVNQYLVEHGFAFAYIVFPNSKLDQFKSWEAEAKNRKDGLWSACQVHSVNEIEQTNAVGSSPG